MNWLLFVIIQTAIYLIALGIYFYNYARLLRRNKRLIEHNGVLFSKSINMRNVVAHAKLWRQNQDKPGAAGPAITRALIDAVDFYNTWEQAQPGNTPSEGDAVKEPVATT